MGTHVSHSSVNDGVVTHPICMPHTAVVSHACDVFYHTSTLFTSPHAISTKLRVPITRVITHGCPATRMNRYRFVDLVVEDQTWGTFRVCCPSNLCWACCATCSIFFPTSTFFYPQKCVFEMRWWVTMLSNVHQTDVHQPLLATPFAGRL